MVLVDVGRFNENAALARWAAPAWRPPSERADSRQLEQGAAPDRDPGSRFQESTLATRAEEGRATALDNPPHDPAAARPARLSLAVVDIKQLGEIAELAVGRGEVAKGRAAGLDRFL